MLSQHHVFRYPYFSPSPFYRRGPYGVAEIDHLRTLLQPMAAGCVPHAECIRVTDTLQALVAKAGADVPADWPRFLAYTLATLICAYLGGSPRLVQRTQRKLRMLWLQLGVLYLLAATSALFQGDELWLHWAREYASAHDAYDERRPLQFTVLLVLFFLFVASWKLLKEAVGTDVLRVVVLAGACGTVTVHLLNYVSFHYTDIVLNAFWMDHSIGAWVELASLSLVGAGTALELVRSHGRV